MINLIHILPTLGNQSAGPSYSVPRLCTSLQNQEFLVDLAVLDDGANINYPFLRKFKMSGVLTRFGISQEMFLWVKKILKNNKITIIHVHSLWMLPNIYPRWLLKNSSKVYSVISPRGTLSNYSMNRNYLLKKIVWTLLQKKVLEDASCIHATAYSEYKDIRRLGFRNPVCIIPNGIDLPKIDNYSKSKRLNRLLFLGRLHPKKGLLNLVTAWAYWIQNTDDAPMMAPISYQDLALKTGIDFHLPANVATSTKQIHTRPERWNQTRPFHGFRNYSE